MAGSPSARGSRSRTLKRVGGVLIFVLIVVGWGAYFVHRDLEHAADVLEAFKKSAASMNSKVPLLVNPELNLYLTQVSLIEGQGVHFDYRFASRAKNAFSDVDLANARQTFLAGYCAQKQMAPFETIGGVTMRYLSEDNQEVLVLHPRPADCGQ